MKPCYCRTILAVAVIVLAWWAPSWTKYALTVIGGLLAVMSLAGNKCCCNPAEKEGAVEEKKE